MTISERLDTMRRALPGCEAVLFVDLSTQMVLGASLALKYPQERLDAICATAARLLAGTFPEGGTQRALIAAEDETAVFLRAAATPEDALCCLCPPQTDLDAVTVAAEAVLCDQGGHAAGMEHGQ